MASTGGGGIIQTILIWMGVLIVVILIIIFFIAGGAHKIAQAAHGISNPFNFIFGNGTSTGAAFRLPWQPDFVTPNVPEMQDSDAGTSPPQSTADQLQTTQSSYERLNAKIAQAQNFGEPSPYRGEITITDNAAQASNANAQYVTIEASAGNSSPIDISGWSLGSAVTGARAFIPRGTKLFLMGAVNPEENIYVNPGMDVIIASGYSPVGVSFRENMCTGYLGQFQSFSPSLSTSGCPAPADSLPLTAENIRAYGQTCFDFLRELPSCTYPTETPGVSSACHIFLTNTISYNGCVANYGYRSDFFSTAWRIYLGASSALWQNGHDVVRLLDEKGRTVDVLTY